MPCSGRIANTWLPEAWWDSNLALSPGPLWPMKSALSDVVEAPKMRSFDRAAVGVNPCSGPRVSCARCALGEIDVAAAFRLSLAGGREMGSGQARSVTRARPRSENVRASLTILLPADRSDAQQKIMWARSLTHQSLFLRLIWRTGYVRCSRCARERTALRFAGPRLI